jgi:hypothetical protein
LFSQKNNNYHKVIIETEIFAKNPIPCHSKNFKSEKVIT